MAIRENRKLTLDEAQRRLFDEAQRRMFFEDTQPASEVLRLRIRACREEKGWKQVALAEAMTDVGVPLTGDKVSKIETGTRSVSYDELLAFAYVLDVPLAELMAPPDGAPPIRAGGIGLERYEVANWLIWGPSWGRKATHARKIIRLVSEVQTMAQVVLEEGDKEGRRKHAETLGRVVTELSQAAEIPRGIMTRQAMRDAAADSE